MGKARSAPDRSRTAAERCVRTKKDCCGDTPRCARCPVVWKRLGDAGLAERVGVREWTPVRSPLPKKLMAKARARANRLLRG